MVANFKNALGKANLCISILEFKYYFYKRNGR